MTAPARVRAPVRSLPHLAPVPRPVPERRPPLRLVDDGRLRLARRRKRGRRVLVAAVVVAGASLLVLAGAHAMLVANQVRLDSLEQEVGEARARHQSLRLEVAMLEAPERIVSTATERLGMVPPASVSYLEPATVGSPPPPVPDGPQAAAGQGPASSWGVVKPHLGGRP